MKKATLMVAIAATCMLVGAPAAVGQPIVENSAAMQLDNEGLPMSRAERQQVTAQIVGKWSYYVQKIKGTDPSVWRRSMAAAFRTADPDNLRRAAKMETYEGMVGVLLGHNTSDDHVINAFATSKAPGNLTAQLLGSPAADLVYNVLTPCRIFDTRVVGGIILSGQTRDFIAYNPGGNFSAQGGNATSDCGVPAYAAAVVINVTDVLPPNNNFITVFPFGENRPTTATILGVKNGNVSNETVVKLTVGAASQFSAFAFGQANLVGDVVGYFSAPEATPVNCVQAKASKSVAKKGGVYYNLNVNCPVGYSATGGGPFIVFSGPATRPWDWTNSESVFQTPNGWRISGKNNSSHTDTVEVRATCCRVPGH